jgi:hypothetical protein
MVEENPYNVFHITPELVQEKFTMAQSYADSAFAIAISTLQSLAALAKGLDPKHADVVIDPIPMPPLPDFTGTRPTPPPIDTTWPTAPPAPTFRDISVIEFPTFPDLTVVPVEPNIPDLPDVELPAPPSEPPALSDIAIPEKPIYELPTPPSFVSIAIPEMPSISLPTFDADPPDVGELIVPEPLINDGNGNPYVSELLDRIKAKILNDITNGSTGLKPEIETAIFQREQERALLVHQEAVDRIASEWAKRGFSLPNGVLTALFQEEEINFTNKRLDVSRDIAIKMAELALQNEHFMVEKGIAFESMAIALFNAVAERTFNASKALAEVLIQGFQAQVAKYGILNDIYKTRAAVYETQIRGELAKAEVYKTQMEGVKAISDVNESYVRLYAAQVSAVEALINIYRVEMEGAKTLADINRLKLDAFRSQIEAYMAQVNAKTAEYNMYRAKIDGEKSKVDIYRTQVDAYAAQVGAVTAVLHGRVEAVKAETEVNKNLATLFASQVDAYRAQIGAEAERIGAIVKSFLGEVELYRADTQAYEAEGNVIVKAYEAEIQQAIAQANILIKDVELEIKNYELENSLKIEAMKGSAAIASQLVAGALSAVSAGAHLQSSGSISSTHSYEEKVLEHVIKQYNY